MAWNHGTKSLDDTRDRWLDAGRPNMTLALAHATGMLHHRIAWSRWRKVLNDVIAGKLDSKAVNICLSLSPSVAKPLVDGFKTACVQVKALKPGKTLDARNVQAIQAVEAEVFSLPINAFLGPTQRGDDPADDMDFTPDDIDCNGAATTGNWGDMQKVREAFYAALLKSDLIGMEVAAVELRKKWIAMGYDLGTPTGFNNAHWAPDPGNPAGRAYPPYRAWIKSGAYLTVEDCRKLTALVQKRVETKA